MCRNMMTASLSVAKSSRNPLSKNLSTLKTMKSWSTTVTAVHVALDIRSSSAKQSLHVRNSSQLITSRPSDIREAISTRSSCQPMVSTLRFILSVKTMRMLKPADALLSMVKCSEMSQLARKFVTQSIWTPKRRKWQGASAASSNKTFAALTC